MAIKVKKITIYRDLTQSYLIEQFEFEKVSNYSYLDGIMRPLVKREDVKALGADLVALPLFGSMGNGKIICDIGNNGLLFLAIRPEYWIEELIIEPDDIIADVLYGESGLIYSFYNNTRRNTIAVTIKIGEDIEGVFRKISSSPEDLNWRQYFVRRAMKKAGTGSIDEPKRVFPEIMNSKEVADYVRVEEKTIRNWTYTNKIPYIKLGSAVRYQKKQIDDALAKSEIGRKHQKKKS